MKNTKPWMVFFSLSILTFGCGKTGPDRAQARKDLLSQSTFYPGEVAPRTTGEAGFIAGPTQNPSSTDGGSISAPGTSGSLASTNSVASVVDSSSSTSTTTNPTTTSSLLSDATQSPSVATAVPVADSASGVASGAAALSVSSTAPSDGGFIANKSPVSGSDAGILLAPTTGTSGTQADASQVAPVNVASSTTSSSAGSSSIATSTTSPSAASTSSTASTSLATSTSAAASSTNVVSIATSTSSTASTLLATSTTSPSAASTSSTASTLLATSTSAAASSTNVVSIATSTSSVASSSAPSSTVVASNSSPASSSSTPTQSGASVSGASTVSSDSGAIPKNWISSTNSGALGAASSQAGSTGQNVPPSPKTSPKTGKEPSPASLEIPNIWKLFQGEPKKQDAPMPKEKFSLKINRVCSVRRSHSSSLFFEEANAPILSIEAVTRTGCKNRLVEVIKSIPLKGVDLLQSRVIAEIDLSLSDFKKKYPLKWRSAELRFSICNDPDGKESCLKQSKMDQLALNAVTSKLNHIPKVVSLDVWSGRALTLKQNPESCEKQYSPIVLDLSGNGVRLSGPEDGVRFDLNATGTPLLTGWINSKENGFLVHDLDKDRQIEDGAELFGSATILKNGKRAVNGFEALKDLDDNNDNTLDARDRAWKDLRVWIDRDFDGESERGELLTLGQLNIEKFDLDYAEIMEVDAFGNQTRQRSTYWRNIHGKSTPRLMVDVWFLTLGE